MEERDLLQEMENWGYLLIHKLHPDSPGCRELLIALRRVPTEKHFDPEEVRLWLRDDYGFARLNTFTVETARLEASPEPKHICPGLVVLGDRKGKQVEFFTFGGLLGIILGSGEVILRLRSPAPILLVTEEQEDAASRLAIETEALMGEVHARWGKEDEGYLRQLAQVDPFEFYIASLNTILKRYQEHPTLQEEDPELYNLVQDEREWLRETGRWPEKPPTLDTYLAPA